MSTRFRKKITLAVLCLGVAMIAVDSTIVNVALLRIGHDFKVSLSALQWIVDSYTLTFGSCMLQAGYFADRFGAKRIFLVGLIGFTFASLGCGLSHHLYPLVAFRLLQGVSSASILPTTIVLIHDLYATQAARSRAIGIWASVAGAAIASGPLFGGGLTALWGWQSVFFVNLPIGLLAVTLGRHYLPQSKHDRKGCLDWAGQLTIFISLASLAFALIEWGDRGWQSPIVWLSFIIFFIAFPVFIRIEHRLESPMFPLLFFKIRDFSIANVVGMTTNLGFYGSLFLLPLYFQSIRGYSVGMTGLAIIPLMGFAALSSYVSGCVTARYGPKWPISGGLFFTASAFTVLAFLLGGHYAYWILAIPMSGIGLGGSFVMPAITLLAIRTVPNNRVGAASAALGVARQLGSLIGVAFFGMMVNVSGHFISGIRSSLFIVGLMYLFVGLLSFSI